MIKEKIITPFQKFINIESLSGILLLIATLAALAWANSPLRDSYQELWQYKLGFTSESFEINKPLILWINDGFMAVFFFLIGLEIKREFVIGELNSIKKLSFPIFGALGGMVIPVVFFLLLNENPETTKGWGVPMATDIAFSLAVLKILGDKVPLSLKLFLTAFAIIDDIGSVVVIAAFYSGTINFVFLLISFVLLMILYYLSYKSYYSMYLNIVFGGIIWVLFLKSGIHPTLAGILLAFSVPVRQKVRTSTYLDNLVEITDKIKKSAISIDPVLTKHQIHLIDDLENWTSKFQSPLQHLEHKLHGWVAYLIIPIFALANAGVAFGSSNGLDYSLIVNIIICLVLGKGIGIPLFVFTAKKLKLVKIPKDINNQHIIGVAFLAGIGFTMAIFIASLAFKNNPEYVDSAKIGILIGSLISAILGFLILSMNKKGNVTKRN